MQSVLHSARARPTIRDVAELAGVSASTVSQAFSGRRPMCAATRERVHSAADALGYRPSIAAQTLVTGRSLLISLVMPDLHNPFYASVAAGVEEVAAEAGLNVIVSNTDMRAEKEHDVLAVLDARGVDGIIFITAATSRQPALERLSRSAPVVVLDEEVEGHFNLVAVDNEGGSRMVAEHLLALGHRRLAVVTGRENLPTTRTRLQGFRDGLDASRSCPSPRLVRVVYADDTLEGGRKAALQVLASADRPTAIYATNDLMALGVLVAARSVGLDVPEELSVAGFDDIPFASASNPTLTTVAQPGHRLGQAAAELLLRAMRSSDGEVERVELPVELRVRESTGPVPSPRSTERV